MKRRVAVTGLGIISPIGNDVDTYLKNLQAGKCAIDKITRFDTADYAVKVAAEIRDFRAEDHMERNEARRADPYTQYAIAAAAQAAKDSDIVGNIAPERLGVYIGTGVGGMSTLIAENEKLIKGGPRRVSALFVPMMIGNIATGAVAIRMNAQGPCLPVVTACATSSNAIGEAYRAIAHGYADAIFAGGAEASIIPLAMAGFTNCMALTQRDDPKTACVPFDKRRDGFVMGEGGGVLVLEEMEHAKARGATIYAEVTGYGHTCDAHHITAPHPEGIGATAAIRQAVSEAGIEASDKLYINAHGTSTPLNDKTETLAIKNAFGDAAYQVHISSTKSMMGHMLGAAGAAEAIASVLALVHGFVPPTVGYSEKDPDCDLSYTPGKALYTQLDAALSTSLGFGGHNACLAFGRA